MKKDKLFYSEDDSMDEETDVCQDDLKTLISADNIREQYRQYALETRRTIYLTVAVSLSAIGIMVLFLWLSFSVFPQHTFSFNFGEGTYTRVLLPSMQSVIMSITVLAMNLFIQIICFYWISALKNKINTLMNRIKLLEFKEMCLGNNLFGSSPALPFLALLHILLILGSLVAMISYIVLAFV